MLFDLTHILYMVISAILSAGLLVLLYLKLKDMRKKETVLKVFAIITVIIHYSSLWVDYLSTGSATVQASMLLPIYPCNVMMWLLLITSFVKKREGFAYKSLSEFTFLAGTFCGIIGILLNENYGATPNLLEYEILKGLLSHSTMVLGCIYLKTAGFVKVRVSNVISVALGLTLFLVDGLFINGLYKVFDLGSVNSMYLQHPPFENLPFLNTIFMGVMGLLLVFIITAIVEQVALPKEERWYTILKSPTQRKTFFK